MLLQYEALINNYKKVLDNKPIQSHITNTLNKFI